MTFSKFLDFLHPSPLVTSLLTQLINTFVHFSSTPPPLERGRGRERHKWKPPYKERPIPLAVSL